MAYRVRLRRGTASQWAAATNLVLPDGQIGYETDTRKMKVGDGQTAWNSLQYLYSSIKSVTFVIAAANSVNKDMADYICTGVGNATTNTADDAVINTAIALLSAIGGTIILLPGTYLCYQGINLTIDNVTIIAYGATITVPTSDVYALNLINNTNDGDNESALINVDANNSKIFGLTIDSTPQNSFSYDFYSKGNGCTFRDVICKDGAGIEGILSGAINFVIETCNFVGGLWLGNSANANIIVSNNLGGTGCTIDDDSCIGNVISSNVAGTISDSGTDTVILQYTNSQGG